MMMARRSLTANFKEIKALEVTCSHCGALFTIPVPKESLSADTNCVGCNKRLWNGANDRAFQLVSGFVLMLSQAQRHDDKVFWLGFSLQMEE